MYGLVKTIVQETCTLRVQLDVSEICYFLCGLCAMGSGKKKTISSLQKTKESNLAPSF